VSEGYVAALDIGGTRIKTGLVDSWLRVVPTGLTEVASCSDQDAKVLLDYLAGLIRTLFDQARTSGGFVRGVGIGFPGPFDYVRGIPFLKGLAKYEALYGVDLRQELGRRLPPVAMRFENDAALFALGEAKTIPEYRTGRLLFLTLGTGCGSSFIENGVLVKGRDGVPANGMIFNQPYRTGVVDDFLSRRGILALAAEAGQWSQGLDVLDLAVMAKKGNQAAREVFNEFGFRLKQALEPYLEAFRPDFILLGGSISRSHELFSGGLGPRVRLSRGLSSSTLVGAAAMFPTEEKRR
jgi:glucokinase